ncbi:MAG: hypothetical protein AB200_00895 [Parcubacteria bacterium C7867-005]|nr:MAG: hypothetical protein AB200_00895 [Parcubacteria bacterium C7867-005]
MVYSTFFSLILIPFLLYFSYSEIFISSSQIIIQTIGGVLLTLSIYFYLMALNSDEASVVIPFALLVPVFGFIFSYFLLGEILTAKQFFASLLVILGAFILSLEFSEERRVGLRHRVLGFMVLCTIFQAAQETLFKFTTIENSFMASIFWLHVGIAICGFALVLFHKNLLSEFYESVRVNGRLVFGVNFISEAVSTTAYMIRDYATLLAPVAIIMALNGYQPAFVFILGIILTLLFPKFVNEKIKATHLIHKSTAIAVMIVGTILISQTL